MIPKDTTKFEVVAKRGKKEARDSATVNVNTTRAAAPTVTLKADQSSLERGQNTTLRWSTEHAKIVTISGMGEVPASGEREISPRVSTTYTATALGDGGNATASARVSVTDPAPPPMAERPRTTTESKEPPAADQFRAVARMVFFDYDKSDILPSEQEKLRRLADWLNQDRIARSRSASKAPAIRAARRNTTSDLATAAPARSRISWSASALIRAESKRSATDRKRRRNR